MALFSIIIAYTTGWSSVFNKTWFYIKLRVSSFEFLNHATFIYLFIFLMQSVLRIFRRSEVILI